MKSKIPVGISDFRELAKGGYLFADKSLLIKDLMESGSRSILFTRPRRFGKTLALSMIDRFFNSAYAEEEAKDDTFAGLNISRCPEYEEWKEKGIKNGYPVIRLDMTLIEFGSTSEFNTQVRMIFENLIKQSFKEILDDDASDPYKNLLYATTEDQFKPGLALTNICQRIYERYKVKPIILIDEYDSPIGTAFDEPWFEEFAKRYGDFLKASLKANLYAARIVLTGVQKYVVKGMFSALNDIDHISVLDDDFSQYFGMTSDEMEQLISEAIQKTYPNMPEKERTNLIASKYSLASEWFDGYHIGGHEIFNPWSAVNFLKNNIKNDRVEPYWNNTSESKVLITLFSEADETVSETVRTMYITNAGIPVSIVDRVTPLWKPGERLDKNELLTILLSAGYLTADPTENGYSLSIPNKEVRLNFDRLMERIYCFDTPRVMNLMGHIMDKDPDAVKSDLETLMGGGSYLDGWKEPRYKTWAHDLFVLNGYVAITERESGEGRIDLLVKGIRNKPPIVFEFKVLSPRTKTDLMKTAEEGLKQITDNRYLDMPEIKGAVALSVAFRKKTCEVVFL